MARKSITFLMLLLFIFGCVTPTTAQQPIPVRPSVQPIPVRPIAKQPIPVISRAQVLTILQKKVEDAEQTVRTWVQQFYLANDPELGGETDENRNSQITEQLRLSVAKLFKLRMQLQTAQLDDAEAKLKTSRQRLVRRQSLAKQIVERRVNELINNDETKWNEQPSDLQKLASPQPKPDPTPTGLAGSTAESTARDEIKSLANACDFYKLNVGSFPTKLLDFSQLPNGLTQAQWGGPYEFISPISNDPWNRPYKYSPSDKANVVLIESAGPDGQFGNSDDVSNAQAIAEKDKGRRVDNGGSTRLPTKAKNPPPLVDPLHKVGPGDVLSISVPVIFDEMNRDKTSPGYPVHVRSDGKISLPYLGRLKVTGKTALEIESELIKLYVDEPLKENDNPEDDIPLLKDYARDMISVVVQQVYKPSAKSKIEALKKSLAELTSEFARAETALGMGRNACVDLIRILEKEGKIKPGQVKVQGNSKRIENEKRMIKELELKRDQLLLVHGSEAQVDAVKAAISVRKKKVLALSDDITIFIGLQPEQIVQRYIVGVKQQIGDIRSALASDLASYRKNYEQAGKPERADAERPNELIARLDNADAAQLAAQTFLDLYFSGDIEKATELTNNPRPLKTLRRFINPGTSAAPKVIGFSGGRNEASISTDGVVQLKKALPRTGHKQAEISLRMQNNDSDGWRVLQVFLGGATTARRKAPRPAVPDQSE